MSSERCGKRVSPSTRRYRASGFSCFTPQQTISGSRPEGTLMKPMLVGKPMLIAIFVVGFVAIGAGAQAQVPSPEPQPTHVPGPRAAANKKLIDDCRAEAKAQGVRGPAIREAVNACVTKSNPRLAKRMACAQQARAQAMTDRAQIKTFVESCLSGAK